ncbi:MULTISPECIES: glycosyltransferase [unclassified Pantoea]|uniref:glycosyltransferase n=1 Tax=unclassified Pantoea TaxID=2630326 RepID=UPI00111E704C|nr:MULTISPECIES: glycosyltransferase [unclassified Pantoea]TPE15920.1 glycosyltransferase [Pantoea vagans]
MKIAALIVTYNRLEKLKKCWAAVEPLSFHEIVIVDNASTDATSDWLNSLNDPRLKIISSEVNDGGAGGFYRGSEWIALNSTPDWVLFFDDDAYPDSTLLEKFVASDRQNAQAIATCVLDTRGARCKMNIPWKKIPNTVSDLLHYSGKNSEFEAVEFVSTEIQAFSFVGVFVAFDTLKETYKFINKSLFIYFDDVFYSWKLHIEGCKLLYNPDLVFHHDVVESSSAMMPWKIYYLARNLISSRYIFPDKKPFSVVSILMRITKYYLMAVKSESKVSYLTSLSRGVIDGLLFATKGLKNGRR